MLKYCNAMNVIGLLWSGYDQLSMAKQAQGIWCTLWNGLDGRNDSVANKYRFAIRHPAYEI